MAVDKPAAIPGRIDSLALRLRRRPGELDWQAELAARSVGVGNPPERKPTMAELRAKRRRALGVELIAGLAAWGAIAAVALYGHHHTTLRVVLAALAAFITPALHGVASARRRMAEKREEQLELEIERSTVGRLDRRLEMISQDLRWLLANPPDRERYERWLDRTTKQIDRSSQDAAFAWSQPDLGRRCTGRTVSAAELDARRKRFLQLYAEVAPAQKVVQMAAELPQAPSARAITSS